MQAEAIFAKQRTPEFLQFVQVAYGYSELALRALATGEDPGPFLNVIVSASERLSLG